MYVEYSKQMMISFAICHGLQASSSQLDKSEALEQQLKLERELRKAAEHALQEAIRMNADARTAQKAAEAELRLVQEKQEGLRLEWAAKNDLRLREKDARSQLEERSEELAFLLSSANLDRDSLKQELNSNVAQMQVLEFNLTSAETSLESAERELLESQSQRISIEHRNAELNSALELSQQENVTLDGKLSIMTRSESEMEARLQSTRQELQQALRDHAQERTSREQANRDALLECRSRCEAEYESVLKAQQLFIADLEIERDELLHRERDDLRTQQLAAEPPGSEARVESSDLARPMGVKAAGTEELISAAATRS